MVYSKVQSEKRDMLTRSKTRAAKITVMSNIMQYKYGLKFRTFTRSFTKEIHNQYKPLTVSGLLLPATLNYKKPLVLFKGCLWEML